MKTYIYILTLLLLSVNIHAQLSTPVPIFPSCGAAGVAMPVLFNWNPVNNAAYFILEVSNSNQNWNANSGFPTASTIFSETVYGQTNYTWNDADPATTYYYSLQAVDNSGFETSDYSSPCQFTTTNTPCSLPAPSGVTTSVISPYQIDIGWNNISNADHFKVYDYGTYIGQTSSNSYSDTGLTPGSTHCYSIAACCTSVSCGDLSNEVCATTTNNTTYVISGKTEKANGDFIAYAQVTFTGTSGNANQQTVTSASDGAYIRSNVPHGWSGNITAQKTDYTFVTVNINNVTSNLPGTDIIGTPVSTGPLISISPTQMDFENTVVGGNSAPQILTISNTGDEILQVDPFNSPGEFLVSGFNGGSVGISQSVTSPVVFHPLVVGSISDFIQITSNATNNSTFNVVVTGNGIAAPTCDFQDPTIIDGSELDDAVTFLCGEGLLDDDGYCEPENSISRAALAKLAYLSIDLQNNSFADDYPSPFMDLQDENTWFYSYAKNLTYLEYELYQDGKAPFDKEFFNFYPAKQISRKFALKVLLETWNIDETNNSGTTPFTDPDLQNDEAYDYIVKAHDLGIIEDNVNHLFNPNDDVLRKDVFIWLYRMMDVLAISVPVPTEDDFLIPGNYTPENFSSFDAMHSGNFNFYTKSSFNISGVGIPLNFAHTYNSYATEITSDLYPIKPMGFGWSHTYNSYIVEVVKEYTGDPADRNAIIHFPTGELNVYEHLGNNQYEIITKGVYDELVKINGGKYELHTKNQITYTYEKFTGTPPSFPYVLTSVTDRNNNTLTINYQLGQNGYYRIYKVVGTNGRELVFTYYNNSDLIETVTDPLGRVAEYDYDGYSFSYIDQPDLVSYTNAKNGETTYNYGNTTIDRHLLLTIDLPKGNTITNTYDSKKLLSSQTNGNNPTNYNIVPHFGQTGNDAFTETTITNPNNIESTLIKYNTDGNPNFIKYNNYDSLVITYHATQTSKPITINRNGIVTSFTYDNNGNLLSISQPMGVTQQYTYNSFNDILTYTDPNSNTYSNSYNGNGNIETITTPRGTTNLSINLQGLVTSITNPAGITTSFTHNSYGDVTHTNSPESISTSASYDIVSRLLSFTNPNGRIITYQFDPNDNLLDETFNGHTTAYTFDPNDNLTHITNANSGVTTMVFDNEDLLRSVNFGSATDSNTYLVDGKINTYTNPNGDISTYQYNSDGRLESVITSGETVSYIYDSQNNIETITNLNGTITYDYDQLDRVTSTTDYYGNVVEYDYDLNSNVTKITYPSSKEVVYSYYPDNLLHTVTDWNNQITSYTYRNDGLLTRTDYPNGSYETLTYDNAGRPTGLSWKKADGTVINEYSYNLDAIGNHEEETKTEPYTPSALPDETISYSYNSTNRLFTAGGDSFSYDANGNTITKTGNTYVYDKYDRLTSVTGSLNAQYEYDANGNRRKSTINGQSKRYVLDILGMSKVLTETDNSDTPQNYYVYGLGLISRIDASNNTSYYHYDFRGSTIAMTDESEVITHKYEYNDFGQILQINEVDFNLFRYVGKYGIQFEGEKLYFMRARYYNPDVGRFLTEDPIWSTNLYPYAGNNPVMNVDASGEVFETVLDIVSIGYSSYELYNNPSWGNAGYLAWDVGATFIPFVPGSYLARGGKLLLKFENVSEYGIDTYRSLKNRLGVNSGLEVHHLIEQRFKSLFGKKANDMESIVLTKNDHQFFTNAWRNEIGYKNSKSLIRTNNVSRGQVENAARRIYENFPEILKSLGL